jgi:hypothetical protein
MAQFCTECGAALGEGNRFCPACGSAVAAVAPPPVMPEAAAEPLAVPTPEPDPQFDPAPEPAPAYADYAEPAPTGMSGRTKSLLLGAGVAGFVAIAAIFAFGLGRDKTDAELTDPAATASAMASEDPNAPRPQEWFDNYKDKFLSAELEQLALASAQKRSFPTAKGSKELGPVARGTLLKGRWVEGGDPKTRWLRLADGSYVWEGNLADPTQINPLGMAGFVSGSRFASIEGRLDAADHEAYPDAADTDNACDQYASADGLVTVMFIGDKVSRVETDSERLETSNGIHVGSTEADLKRGYGSVLKREQDHYSEGWNYYLWSGKDRGIRFDVSGGKVTAIYAGDETIRYIEGCS